MTTSQINNLGLSTSANTRIIEAVDVGTSGTAYWRYTTGPTWLDSSCNPSDPAMAIAAHSNTIDIGSGNDFGVSFWFKNGDT